MHSTPEISNGSNQFLSLPPELHALIFEHLGFPPAVDPPPEYGTWAALERTCRQAQEITEPYLYYKIYSNVRTHGRATDTPWKTDPGKQKNDSASGALGTVQLANLLERRPRLQKLVHFLVLDEYDPIALTKLLRMKLEGLESVICQHEGEVAPAFCGLLDDPEAVVRQQNKLTNFVLSIHRDTSNTALLQPLTLPDAPLIRQPATTRIRLSYLDITCLEDVEPDYFIHTKLQELNLEHCKHNLPALNRLLRPSQTLTKLYLHFDGQSPFTAEEERALIPMVHSIAGKTLKILKFIWRETRPQSEDWPGWDLTHFEAMRYLHVPPRFLFPSKSGTPTSNLLSQTLPPRLKILGLEGMIPIDFAARCLGLGLVLSQDDVAIIEALIAYKSEGNVPSFKHLLIWYAEDLAGIPHELVKKAAEQGISLGFLEARDQAHMESLNMQWLDGEQEHRGGKTDGDADESSEDEKDEAEEGENQHKDKGECDEADEESGDGEE